MKVQKNISIDIEVASAVEQRKGSINVSQVCNNALRIASGIELPKEKKDIKLQLIELKAKESELKALLDKNKKQEEKEVEKRSKEDFKEDFLRVAKLRNSSSSSFPKARQFLQDKYSMTNAEVMKELDKL